MAMTEREKKHLKRVYKMLPECTVLLKSNGDFPLQSPCKLALYGNGARNTLRGGTGSGEVYSRFTISAEQGLRKAGFQITTAGWLNDYDEIVKQAHLDFVQEIRARAKKRHMSPVVEGMGAVMPQPEYELPIDGAGDTAVYVLSRICGEGNDREPKKGDILLSDTEVRDILTIHKKYPKFLLVLNVGAPIDLTPVLAVENILLLSQLGAATGRMLADLLLGKCYPSGRLTDTWTAWKDQPETLDFGGRDDTRYLEGVYVGYRYCDSLQTKVLFPFGYGLSYTEFAVECKELRAEKLVLSAKVSVRNTGESRGKEVVQFYLSYPETGRDKPVRVLAGWGKTKELSPGEEQELSVRINLKDVTIYDTKKASYLLEQGDHILYIGKNSREVQPAGIVRVEEEIPVRKVRNLSGRTDFKDLCLTGERKDEIDTHSLFTVTIKAAECEVQSIDYKQADEIDKRVKNFTDEELLYLNIGAFDERSGIRSVIGNAGRRVAGAAGETTSKLRDKGVEALVMADGPAGLRLSKRYWKEGEYAFAVGNSLLAGLEEFLPKYQSFLMKVLTRRPKKGAKIREQFTTAIPIGTAIAQSFNLELAQACGDIVGSEMEEFGVQLWLAPALNLHRSIRCGRNFEYYSEDPLISGYFAAALTKGVQSHKGCGVTIKHYAANNQEYNRFQNNSMVSERALRELYLRSFEICVREAHPMTVMTSYNLLNGVHTSERRDLIEDVLRREFGFDGVVMTDWIVEEMTDKSSKYPVAVGSKIASAGSELVMPGSSGNFKEMLAALREGSLSRRQLEVNASRMLRLIDALREKDSDTMVKMQECLAD